MKELYKYFSLFIIILLSSFIFFGVFRVKPALAQSVIKTIDVGDNQFALEYNPINGTYIYLIVIQTPYL